MKPRAPELRRYMPKILFVSALIIFFTPYAFACSCGSFTPLAVVYEKTGYIVHVKVEEIHKKNIAPQNEKPEIAISFVKVQVIKSIKGDKLNSEIAIIPSWCGKSIDVENLEIGHEYILPISSAENNKNAIDHDATDLDKFILPGCAHSGGELIKGEIYDYEYVSEAGRTFLKHFMNYNDFTQRYGI